MSTRRPITPLELGFETRNEVLTYSLILEGLITTFLASLLGIQDWRKSKFLSKNLPFSKKVDLLIEIGALSSIHQSKYRMFMSVRNKLAHNIEAVSYVTCFSFMNGEDVKILDKYPQPTTLSQEERLQRAVRDLGNEILKITLSLTDKLKKKIKNEVDLEAYKKFQEAYFESMTQFKTLVDSYFENEIETRPTMKTVRYRSFGSGMAAIINRLVERNFDRLNSQS